MSLTMALLSAIKTISWQESQCSTDRIMASTSFSGPAPPKPFFHGFESGAQGALRINLGKRIHLRGEVEVQHYSVKQALVVGFDGLRFLLDYLSFNQIVINQQRSYNLKFFQTLSV